MITDVRSTMVTQEEIFSLLSQQHPCPVVPKDRFYSILLQLPKNHLVYVYRDDNGKLVGMVTLWIEQKLSHGGLCIGHITDLVVDKGIVTGEMERELIEHCIVEGQLCNCCRMVVHCSERNVSLCRDMGFKHYGRTLTMSVKPYH